MNNNDKEKNINIEIDFNKDVSPTKVKEDLESLGIKVSEKEDTLDIFEFHAWLENNIKSRFPELWNYMNTIERRGLDDVFYFSFNRAAHGDIGGAHFYLICSPETAPEILVNEIIVGKDPQQFINLYKRVAQLKPYAAITWIDTASEKQFDEKRKKDIELVSMCFLQTPYWIMVIQIPVPSSRKRPRFNMKDIKETASIDVVKPDRVKAAINISHLLSDSIFKQII